MDGGYSEGCPDGDGPGIIRIIHVARGGWLGGIIIGIVRWGGGGGAGLWDHNYNYSQVLGGCIGGGGWGAGMVRWEAGMVRWGAGMVRWGGWDGQVGRSGMVRWDDQVGWSSGGQVGVVKWGAGWDRQVGVGGWDGQVGYGQVGVVRWDGQVGI